jgi:hypothetical protein
MAKREMYSFSEKHHSKQGILSTIIAGASFVSFFVLVCVSYVLEGKAGAYAGGIGLSVMLLSIYGLVIGLKSFKEHNKLYLYSKLGSVLNGLALVGWLSLILIGL